MAKINHRVQTAARKSGVLIGVARKLPGRKSDQCFRPLTVLALRGSEVATKTLFSRRLVAFFDSRGVNTKIGGQCKRFVRSKWRATRLIPPRVHRDNAAAARAILKSGSTKRARDSDNR
jgi:hypothetical protein